MFLSNGWKFLFLIPFRYNWLEYNWEYQSMVGRHKKYSISSISWLMEVCIYFSWSFYLLFYSKLAIFYLNNVIFYFLLVRCVVFAFRRDVQKLNPEVSASIQLFPLLYTRITNFPWYKFFVLDRLCNTFYLVCQALHFSQRMHCLYCSGQKFTIRFV